MKKHIIMGMMAVAMLFSSCSLDTAPTNRISDSDALSTIPNLNLSMRGLYRFTTKEYWGDYSGETYGVTSFNMLDDIYGGTIVRDYDGLFSDRYSFYDVVKGTREGESNQTTWMLPYGAFRRLNKMIEVVHEIPTNDSEVDLKNQLIGELYTMRSYFNHYLNVKYSTHYMDDETAKTTMSVIIRENTLKDPLPRRSQYDVAQFALTDIDKAIAAFKLIKNPDMDTKIYNLTAARLVKARIQMYTKDYAGALATAEEAIADPQGKALMGPELYKAGFNATNQEWIYGAYYTTKSTNGSFMVNARLSQRGRAANWTKPMFMDLSYLKGIDGNNDLLTDDSGAVIEATYDGGLPNTVGLTMRADSDSRAELIIHDTKEEIKANLLADAEYYVKKGYAKTTDWIIPGMCNKYTQLNAGATNALADVVMMRFVEFYYIAAESAAYSGQDGKAAAHLMSTVSPYDKAPGLSEHLNKSGDDLKTLIANYKAVDMWGEGRSLEDVKRRGEWVYRIGKYSYVASISATRQYKSTSPYLPAQAAGSVQMPDILTLPIPQSEFLNNPLATQQGNH